MHAVARYDNIDELPDYWHEPEARFALAELDASGLPLPDFARRHQIHVAKLRRWHRRIEAGDPTPRFVELTIAKPERRASTDQPFRLHFDDIALDVPPRFCEDDLARLLVVLSC